jgi:uncharacterized membrane protein YphA (DoxX/SURF4 family)
LGLGGTTFRDAAPYPHWVAAILDWSWTWLGARIALTAVFILSGVTKLLDFPGAVAEHEGLGFQPGWLWGALTIAIQLIGSGMIIWGRLLWLGAGALGVWLR